MTVTTLWQGGHVSRELEITVGTDQERSILAVDELVGIALRRNPKRAHLLVSTVLAKHVPTVPGIALAAGELLGLLASESLGDPAPDAGSAALGARLGALIRLLDESAPADAATLARAHADLAGLRRDIRETTTGRPGVVTIGYAETATGLGQLVADALGSYYLHSTRHAPEGAASFAGFEEEHSHATDHGLLPTDPHWLRPDGTVVLVDDELSTGTTVVNTVTAVQALVPQRHWVIASLIDLRSPADRARFDELAARLGTRISVVSLAAGPIELPADVLARSAALLEALPIAQQPPHAHGQSHLLDATDLPAVRSARFGTTQPVDTGLARAVAERILGALPDSAGSGRGVLVLGSEEFIALPMTIADELARAAAPVPVRFSTSTRSPIAQLDAPDYPIAGAVAFRSHDTTSDGVGPRFAYNLTRAGRGFDTVVFLPEPGTDPALLAGPDGVIEALRAVSAHVIVVLLQASAPGSFTTSASSSDGTPAP